MEVETELLGDFSVDEIKKGFMEDKEGYICLMCGERFDKGEIYTMTGRLFEGSKAIKVHIEQEHQSVMKHLLKVEAQQMGISELQVQLLNFFASGMTDKEIAEEMGVSCSTIRNHRYKLRERERQNKVFLALMETLKEEGIMSRVQGEHVRENNIYDMTPANEKEKRRILERYMTETGILKSYPKFEKNRRVILEAILANFQMGQRYTEGEVNQILSEIYKDYKLLRDELMAYDYMDRTNKGAIYWIKNYETVSSI